MVGRGQLVLRGGRDRSQRLRLAGQHLRRALEKLPLAARPEAIKLLDLPLLRRDVDVQRRREAQLLMQPSGIAPLL